MGGLLRLLLLAIAIWLIISSMRRLSLLLSFPRSDKDKEKDQEGMLLVQDPQCGRFVPERDAVRTSFRGQILHFCSQECRDLYTHLQAAPRGKKEPQ
jgi:YHS domain-containing protein